MTHSYVRHDSLICVPWLIHMCAMTHSYVCHDSFICVTWLIHMWDMTHWYVWHALGIRAICHAWHKRVKRVMFVTRTWLVYTFCMAIVPLCTTYVPLSTVDVPLFTTYAQAPMHHHSHTWPIHKWDMSSCVTWHMHESCMSHVNVNCILKSAFHIQKCIAYAKRMKYMNARNPKPEILNPKS